MSLAKSPSNFPPKGTKMVEKADPYVNAAIAGEETKRTSYGYLAAFSIVTVIVGAFVIWRWTANFDSMSNAIVACNGMAPINLTIDKGTTPDFLEKMDKVQDRALQAIITCQTGVFEVYKGKQK